MKTTRYFEALFVAVASCLMLSACDYGKIKVKGADGTIYESYQECCAAQDFTAAHQFLTKMEDSLDLEDARDYVFRQEALFLMSQGNETAQKRIVYLLKEEGGNDRHVNMLIELAIDDDEEEFVKSLTKQYVGEPSEDVLRKIVQYLYLEKSDTNLDFVTALLNRYDQGGLLLDAVVEKGSETLLVKLAQQYKGTLSFDSFKNAIDFMKATNSINYQTVLEQLITKVGKNDPNLRQFVLNNKLTGAAKEYSDMILTLIAEEMVPSDNLPHPAIGMRGYYEGTDALEAINKHNENCRKLLNTAINAGNKDLAQKALRLFTKDILIYKGGSDQQTPDGRWATKAPNGIWVDGNHCYVVKYTEESKSEAQKTYQMAVRSGAFK